jgi:hypothetical protein
MGGSRRTSHHDPLAPAPSEGGGRRVSYVDLPVGASTYKGGAHEPVHRWFRLTPSFGPALVDRLLDGLDAGADSLVLDPFAGAGTTPIQARRRGIPAVGIEINPLLAFVSRVRATCRCTGAAFAGALDDVLARAREALREVGDTPVERIGIPLPPIHDVFRWWRPDVLRDLLVLRRTIEVADAPADVRDLLRLTLLGVLVPDLTNVSLGRLQLTFVDRSGDAIDVLGTFEAHGRKVASDLARERLSTLPPARVVLGDATVPGHDLGGRPTHVVTSPPYPNRYSYVWNTRPHLYFAGMFHDATEAGALDLRAIGGTWGAATTRLRKGRVEPADARVATACGDTIEAVRARDPMMANYLAKYWNQVSAAIAAVAAASADDVRMAWVIGCSRVKGEFVESDRLLAELFEAHGFGRTSIERFRRRHADLDLFESVVHADR